MKWNSSFMQKKLLLDVMFGTHYQKDSNRAADGSAATSNSPKELAYYYNVNWKRNPEHDMVNGYHQIGEFEPLTPAAMQKCADVEDSCKATEYITGSPRDLNEATYNRYHGSIIVSYLLSAAGHHLFKAGVDGEYTSYQNQKSNRVFAETEDGTQFDDEERFGRLTGPDMPMFVDPLTKKTASMTIGGFIQDSWSVLDKVTVNLGLRYDAQYFYNTQGNTAMSLPNQWSPRLGLIYDPTQQGKSKVFVNYARYYENAPLDFADVGLVGEPQLTGGHACNPLDWANQRSDEGEGCQAAANLRPNVAEGASLPNRIYHAGGNPGTLDPDTQASSSDEISVGGEYEVLPDARVGATYTQRWVNRWIEDMGPFVGLPGYAGNPGFGLGSFFPKVERNYKSVTLFFAKSFSNSWLAQASYTLGFLKGNYAGLIAPEDGYLGPNATADFDGPNVHINRNGALPGDIRHNVKILGSREWRIQNNMNVNTGFALRARSGRPTSYLGNDPYTYPTESYLVERGTGPRTPWVFGADISLAYRFAMSKSFTLAATMDIFNILNLQAITSTNEEYTPSAVIATPGYQIKDLDKLEDRDHKPVEVNPAFGRPTGYQDPRVFRFGVRGEF
jgi:hypothetical protein